MKLLSTDLKWLNFEHACWLNTVLCADRYIIVKAKREKSISEIKEDKSVTVFVMFNLTILATCLYVIDEADNIRITNWE